MSWFFTSRGMGGLVKGGLITSFNIYIYIPCKLFYIEIRVFHSSAPDFFLLEFLL
jgi:hypothetical protein